MKKMKIYHNKVVIMDPTVFFACAIHVVVIQNLYVLLDRQVQPAQRDLQ